MSKNNVLIWFVLILTVSSLVLAVVPLSDFDLDGFLDSPVSDDFLLLPTSCFIIGLFFLWNRFPVGYFDMPRFFYSPLVPPPISNS
jgi:hypothetical protein